CGVTCVKAERLPSDAAGRPTSRARPDWLYYPFDPRVTQGNPLSRAFFCFCSTLFRLFLTYCLATG
ncbi:hypothetical protein, partial [Xenorhabdus bovienii]